MAFLLQMQCSIYIYGYNCNGINAGNFGSNNNCTLNIFLYSTSISSHCVRSIRFTVLTIVAVALIYESKLFSAAVVWCSSFF